MRTLPGARLVVVLLAALGLVLTAGAARAGTGQDAENLVKVLVVPQLNQTGGQAVTLSQVASATLGDPNRAGEIFELNRGQRQPDGGALGDPDEQLRPGWILRLPEDASGQLVQLARETGDDAVEMDNGQVQGGSDVSFPLAAALAVIGSVLLALVTAAIVARRRVSHWFAGLRRVLHRLGEPARRRRKLRLRQWLTTHFASDADSTRRAYGTIGTLASAPAPEGGVPQVHALQVNDSGVTIWVSADTVEATPPAGWQALDETRWRASGTPFGQKYGDGTACLVRVGAALPHHDEQRSEAVFVDLSRLDGILSVTGDPQVAQDVIRNLLSEVAALQPGTPVLMMGSAGLELPTGLNRVSSARSLADEGLLEDETVRVGARRRPVRGLVVVAGTPDQQTLDDLRHLCGARNAGWTGLVAGDVALGAHWRWHAVPEGEVRIPVLDLEATVPA